MNGIGFSIVWIFACVNAIFKKLEAAIELLAVICLLET